MKKCFTFALLTIALTLNACGSAELSLPNNDEQTPTTDGDTDKENTDTTDNENTDTTDNDTDSNPSTPAPAIRVTLGWEELTDTTGTIETDFDLFMAKYGDENSTFGVSTPASIFGRQYQPEVTDCQSDSDCSNGQKCTRWAQNSDRKVCYDYTDKQIQDSTFFNSSNTSWGELEYDAIHGNEEPDAELEAIKVEKANEGDKFRVVIMKSSQMISYFDQYVTDSTVDTIERESLATLKIYINGKLCVASSYAVTQSHMIQKAIDVKWQAGNCEDVKVLNLPAYETGGSIVHDPAASENSRSIWTN